MDEDEESDDDDDGMTFELERADGSKEDVTQQELLDGYLRQSDYTRKTQKLADDRKATEAVAVEAASARDQYAQQLVALAGVLEKAKGTEPDWDKLRREDPTEYSRRFTDWQIQEGNLKKVADEQARVTAEGQADFQRKLQAHMTDEAAKLRAAIPEFQNPKKAKALTEKLVEYGVETGKFTKEELADALDHRVLVMLNKARLYDKLQAKKPALKSKTKRARSMKPGARKEPGARTKLRIKRAQKAAKRTGRPRDAAAAIESLLPDDIF